MKIVPHRPRSRNKIVQWGFGLALTLILGIDGLMYWNGDHLNARAPWILGVGTFFIIVQLYITFRLLNREVQRRRLMENRLILQYSTARSLAESSVLSDAVSRILKELGMALNGQAVIFWNTDLESNTLQCAHVWHIPSLNVDNLARLKMHMESSDVDRIALQAWKSMEVEWADSTQNHLHSVFAFPVILNKEILGVFEFFSDKPYPEEGDLVQTLYSIGVQVGQYIEGKRAETELQHARDTALEAVRFKSEFMANMSHEIRTPLNAILGMTDMLDETVLSAEQRQFTTIVLQAGASLLQIINDILDFSKIEAGKMTFECVDLDLRDTAESVTQMLSEKAHAKQLELACLISSKLPTLVQSDSVRLRQILINLVGNAVKFTEKGHIIVGIEKIDETAAQVTFRLSVKDSGIGIAPEGLKNLFQAFSQADGSTTRKYGGTGLGLAISKRIVELMGGTIGVSSVLGEGSTFWISIPFLKSVTSGISIPIEVRTIQGLRVLIVHDEPSVSAQLVDRLAFWGMRPTCVSPAAALKMSWESEESYARIILDSHRPSCEGMRLAQHIRDRSPLTTMRIVMLTTLEERIPDAMKLTLDLVPLTKPLRQMDLLASMVQSFSGTMTPSSGTRVSELSSQDSLLTLRILVAEDNIVNQRVVLYQLGKLGYTADIASSGPAVLEAVQNKSYDLIFMDCQMPEMDGYQTATELRKREHAAAAKTRTPIVAMTANALEGDRQKCLNAGMDDYISKPVHLSTLRAAIDRWSQSAAA